MEPVPAPDPRPKGDEVVRRREPAGLIGGARLSLVEGPRSAFQLAAPGVAIAEARLRVLLASEVEVVAAIGAYLADSGGKRLRPMLTVLGAMAVGHERAVGSLACVGELIHLGSLLHDDVVDDAGVRRGRAAAHVVFGNAASILSGDFCLARAVLLAAEDGGLGAVTELGRAVTAMAEGEVLQLQRSGNLDTTRDEYFEMVEKKSAALIAWCAAAGALAGGHTAEAGVLARFGTEVGIAFQVTDDVLDYRAGTGKPAGQDLKDRKVTLPLVHALARVPGLRERLTARAPRDEELPELLRAVEASGALEAAGAEARSRVEGALEMLAALEESAAKDALAALARYLVDRAR